MKRIIAIFAFFILLTGCNVSERYELTGVPIKDAYGLFKIDKQTGEVWRLDRFNDFKWKKLPDTE